MKKYLFLLVGILCLIIFLLKGCYIFKGGPSTTDYLEFSHNEVSKGKKVYHFPESINPINLPDSINVDGQELPFEEAMAQSNSSAIIILNNGSIEYERYYDGHSRSSIVTSFSVAKSIVSALLGIAINEGYINGISDRVIEYLPELDEKMFKDLTIEHLLDMNSHIQVAENYVTGIRLARFYYGKDIKAQLPTLKRKLTDEYDGEYKSINTQLVGLIIERATKTQLSKYLSDKLWQKIGTEYGATWSTDSEENKTEKSFCCINATAIDFLKIGFLYLNNGVFNQESIVPSEWIDKTYFPLWEHWKEMEFYEMYTWYHNYWYNFMKIRPMEINYVLGPNDILLDTNYQKTSPDIPGKKLVGKFNELSLFARGHLGQYIFLDKTKEIVMVRFGKDEEKIWFPGVFMDILESN